MGSDPDQFPPEMLAAMCDALAHRIGAARATAEGAGHEIQFTGQPVNDALLALWCSA